MRTPAARGLFTCLAILGCQGSLAVAAPSQVHLYGGNGTLEGRFETATGEIDLQGWLGVECPEVGIDPLWQVSDFQASNLNSHGPGNHAMWAGRTAAQRPGWEEPPGYGDFWDTVLLWRHAAPNTTTAFLVQLDAVYNHDIEWFYDLIHVEWNQAGTWQSLEQIDGRSFDVGTGEFLPPGVAMFHEWTVQPEDLVDGEVQIRIRVDSDQWVSDESGTVGSNPGDSNGAIQIDDITVSFDGVPVDGGGDADGTASFENGDDEGWTPQPDTCSCSIVAQLANDIDPGPDNLTPQIGLFRSSAYPGTQNHICRFKSPAIDWDVPEAQDFDSALVRFRFYCESNAGDCGVWLYYRSRVAGQWRSLTFVESWSAPATGWQTIESVLTDHVVVPPDAEAIQIILRVSAIATETRRTFDDMEVLRFDSTATPVPPITSIGRIELEVFPNPTHPTTSIRYVLDASRSIRIALYDARGRRVRTIFEGHTPAGAHTLQFDGRDDAGRTVASGVYFVRLMSNGEMKADRVVIVR